MSALDFDNLETYFLLVEVSYRWGVDPSSSLESEQFFRDLLKKYKGPSSKEDVAKWFEIEIRHNFTALGERPRWIQEPEWPFAKGKPMVFAGQIDVSTKGNGVRFFHDDTSLYVCVSPDAAPTVIIQQF